MPIQLPLFPEEPGAATGSGGAGIDAASADGATAPDVVTVNLVYDHQINADKRTYIRELMDQIQGQVDGFNRDLEEGGVQGLRDKITNYQQNSDDIDRIGRSSAKQFKRLYNRAREFPKDAPIYDTATGERLSPPHEQDMAVGGDPRGVTRLGLARNDFIIGGQADDIAGQIFAADDSVTRFSFRLIVRGLGRGGTRQFFGTDDRNGIPEFLPRP